LQPEDRPVAGSFLLLTYNVAGLPYGLSQSNPETNHALISPLLNAYDVAVLQEDFGYHDNLASASTHPYRSSPMGTPFGKLADGLSLFSNLAVTGFERREWDECNGTLVPDHKYDCLASKGFFRTRFAFPGGAELDVYGVHHDAGRDEDDAGARQSQVEQLLAFIQTASAGRALIVAGDTNMRAADEAVFQRLLTGAGLIDACRALDCPEPERIDRVMMRSSPQLQLRAQSWAVDDRFVDATGQPLSDHEAVAVSVGWSIAENQPAGEQIDSTMFVDSPRN
jgi:endonuclease/exonuclease/phosphatase family metal-dependent hydrolase